MPKTVQNYVDEGLITQDQVVNAARTLISKNNAIWSTANGDIQLVVVDRVDFDGLSKAQQLNLIDILLSATASIDDDPLCP